MNLILHIVRKDFLFLRTRLGVWLAVMAAKIALGFWLVLRADVSMEALHNLQGGVVGLVIFDAALTLLLAALLVQEDGVAGTPAFWRTRPISGRRLLAAKILGAFLLLVVPSVLVAVPWWLLCGFGPAQIAMAALEVTTFQVALLVVAFTAASVTNSLARCLVWGIVGGLALPYVAGWCAALLAMRTEKFGGPEMGFVSILFLFVVGAAVIGWRYLSRRAEVGVALLVVGGLLAPPAWYGVMLMVEARRVAPEQWPRKEDPALTRDIALEWKSARAAVQTIGAKKQGYLNFNYEMKGVPAGYVVSGWSAKQAVRGSVGEPISLLRSGVACDDFPRAIPAVLENASRPGGSAMVRTVKVRSTSALSPEAVTEVRKGAVSLHGTLSFQLARPTLVLEVPLQSGNWQAQHGRGARVIRVEKADRGWVTQVVDTSPLVVSAETRRALGAPKLPAAAYSYYALVRWPGQSVALARQDRPYATLVLGGVQLRQGAIELGGAAGKTPLDWAAGRLQWVDLSDWTLFHRDVKLEGVAVE